MINMLKVSTNLTFEKITYIVEGLKTKQTILNNISGTFPCGKLIAILGPSGAGKTTLLNILSGWKKNKFSGKIMIDNKERELQEFKAISCYITQESHLNDTLSVEENLKYAADLKLGRRVSKNTKQEIISEVVNNFGLTESLKISTGSLSGGQRKRLAICLELLNDPDIIFLDEPTTGLDSVSTTQCVRYLKQFAEKGNTVICTMHQAPGNVIKMLDLVYVVAKGQCIFQGDPKELVTFLDDIKLPCEIFHSPLEYLIEIANTEENSEVLEKLLETSGNGTNFDYMPQEQIKQCEKDINRKRNVKNNSFLDDLYEFRAVIKREMVKLGRDKILLYLRFISIFFYCIAPGLVCYNIGQNATLLYFNYNMILLHNSMMVMCFGLLACVRFVLNQNIIRNEYENGYYSIRNYFLSTFLELPITISLVAVGATLLYWLSGQYMTYQRIFMFVVISIEVSSIANSIGTIFGTILGLNHALIVFISIHIPIFVISGYGISIADMPRHFYYLSYLSYTRFSVRTFMGIVMGYDRPSLICPEDAIYCQYKYALQFLEEMGLEDYFFVYDSLILLGFYIVLRIIIYMAIRYRLTNGIYIE